MSETADYRHAASRPALPIAFACAVLFWASSAFSYSQARCADDQMVTAASVVSLALAIACVIVVGVLRSKALLLAVGCVALGCSLSCAHAHVLMNQVASLSTDAPEEVSIVLEEDSINRGRGEQALVRVSSQGAPSVLCTAYFTSDEIRYYGDRLTGTARYTIADYKSNERAWQDGSCGTIRVQSERRSSDSSFFRPLLDVRIAAIEGIGSDDDQHSILQALVCGYRRNIRDTEMYASYQSCGLAHLVAVSGAHLVIVTGMFGSLLRSLGAPKRFSIFSLVLVMVAYLVLSGCPVSALRATVMSSIGVLALFGRRRPSSLNALGIGIFAIIAVNPSTSVSVSFALSALSTAGIVLFCPLFESWLSSTFLNKLPALSDALSMTFSSCVLSQLYACSVFSLLPVVSPVANAVSAPLFPLVCSMGLLSGILEAFQLPGADVVLGCASGLCWFLNSVVGVLAAIPYASIPFSIDTPVALVVSALVACALWVIWTRFNVAAAVSALVALCVLAYIAVPHGGDTITLLDVGQGDSILVQSQGKSLLIDTGNQDSLLREELARNRVAHLDAVLITHADDDHFGSLDVLRDCVQVDRVILAADMLECQSEKPRGVMAQSRQLAEEVIGVSVGDQLELGAFTATVVWPEEFKEEGGNADSLCLWMDYDGDMDGAVDHTALFTGDAEKDELEQMVKAGSVGEVDILKVGHHGSRNGMTFDEVEELRPTVALIGVGENNRYGHPTQEILDMLSAVSCSIYRTDEDGEVTCMLTPESISVRCMT